MSSVDGVDFSLEPQWGILLEPCSEFYFYLLFLKTSRSFLEVSYNTSAWYQHVFKLMIHAPTLFRERRNFQIRHPSKLEIYSVQGALGCPPAPRLWVRDRRCIRILRIVCVDRNGIRTIRWSLNACASDNRHSLHVHSHGSLFKCGKRDYYAPYCFVVGKLSLVKSL